MKLSVLLFCIFLFPTLLLKLSAQDNILNQKDSLLHVISTSRGEEKLKAYSLLTLLPFSEEETEVKLNYINDFIKEAQKQQNKEFMHDAYRMMLITLYNDLQIDDFQREAAEYMPFFKTNHFSKTYFYIYELLLRTYGAQGDGTRVINEAKRMYDEAKTENCLYGMTKSVYMLGVIYFMEKRYDEAETFMRETIEKAKELLEEDNDKDNHILLSDAYSELVNALLGQKKTEDILPVLPIWRKQLASFEQFFGKDDAAGSLLEYYSFSARTYSFLNDYDKAEVYCDSLEQINYSPIMLPRIWEYRSQISEGRKEYDKAIYWIDKTIEENSRWGEERATVIFMRHKARILCKMGRGEDAWPVYDSAFNRNDSLHVAEYNAQLDELRTIYEVDKITFEKERNRNYMLFALGGCFLLVILLGIWIYYHRQIAKKNKTLVLQIKRSENQEKIFNNEALPATSFSADETDDSPHFWPEKRKDQLCSAIRDIILKEKIYRNPSINRNFLINRLNTNKDLFIESFQYCFEMSFSELINTLRLKDAIILLEQSDLSIEVISEKVGFGTVRTFQRQFRSKYNMSPKEYRKFAQQEQ